ncbi:MAG: hypothetical protein Q8941_22985 [Bacteroidota bacterium]|nr:hypothetical protein [Bacteroidota bacterium]
MSKLSKRHFWDWFRRHHPEYLTLNKKSKKEAAYWLNELNAHLRAYFKFFGFSLELQQERTATLTITVNGKSIHFKKAEALVAKAPEIPGWTFVALEDPRPVDFLLAQQMKDTGIDPRELRFSFANNDPQHIALIVYHPLCTPENEHLIYQLAHTAVYNLLGERSFGTDISWLEVANLSSADPDDVEELEALPDRIGRSRSAIVVDSRGNLVSMD